MPAFLYGGGVFWRQAAAFVFLYVALKGAYVDDDAEGPDDYSVWGFVMGLFAFFSFAVFQDPLRNPFTKAVHDGSEALSRSWVGSLAAAYAALRAVYLALRWVKRKLSWKPKLRSLPN